MSAPRTIRASELVEDFDLYPRHSVDSSHVTRLAEALRTGVALPPVIYERRTKRIVDGFHRVRAYRKVHGPAADVPAEGRTYASEADLLREAVALNSAHGRRLDKQDLSRAALLLEKQGCSLDEIGVILHLTPGRVHEIVEVKIVKLATPDGGTEKRPAKPVVIDIRPADDGAPPEPRTLTEEQYKVMQSSSGWRTGQAVTQLTRELEAGLIDVSDTALAAKLLTLAEVIRLIVPRAA